MRIARDQIRRSLACAALALLAMLAVGAPGAYAEAPAWSITTEAAPTNLAPGGEGQLIIAADDIGDGPANGGAGSPITITDVLPAGVKALAITGTVKNGVAVKCPPGEPPAPPFTCTFTGTLNPYERLTITITIKAEVPPGTVAAPPTTVTAGGGGAVAAVTRSAQLHISAAPTAFGVQNFESQATTEAGAPDTQSGGPPFQLTTTLVTNQSATRQPASLPKDLLFDLPPGLIGNPTAVAQCSEVDFAALVEETNLCPPSSVVGIATLVANEPAFAHVLTKTVPVFNLVPGRGEPARLGFEVIGKVPVVIDTSVRSGRDYGVVATVENATQVAGLLSSQVTLWGDPGDARHNNSRGWECVAGGSFSKQVGKSCPASSAEPARPFLRAPTSCADDPGVEPAVSTASADSWAEPGVFTGASYEWLSEGGVPLGFTGCSQLPFSPSLGVAPESEGAATHVAASPTGLTVRVQVPQQALLEPEEPAEADVRDSSVTLPEGMQLSPSAANGLQACSEGQVGFEAPGAGGMLDFSSAPAVCPDASKAGVVRIRTPLLAHELEGYAYLATPAPFGEPGKNPFNSLIALYIVAEDPVSGVLVKLAGQGHLDEATGGVSTTFANTPQVPFEELKLELFAGPRAPVSTPATCGSYSTEAVFTPWSGTGPVAVSSLASEFVVSQGVGGSACPLGGLAFSPGFLAKSVNPAAGAFTSFELELSRPDGDQDLEGLSMHLPGGVAAMLSNVTLCSEAQAQAASCPASSEVGQASAVSGLGSEPVTVGGGRVFLTGAYDGAPFGLEIVTPAVAGPFDLGFVTVRSKLFINPENASVTIVSDPLPTQLRGIPLQLKRVLVDVNRPDFEFNPTNCDPMRIEGTIIGAEDASAGVSSPFQVSSCGALPFGPQLSASAVGHGSKAQGTTFKVTVTSGGVNGNGVAQAGIDKVDLQLPKQLSSRLPTLQKACTEAVFNSNPAACDEGSVIGYATIHTPVLRNPLTGPAYLVSHGNAAFPDVEFVLQGEGIKLVLDGKTQIKSGITYSKFESTPDAPFTTFETVLPAGPHSVLTPNVAESKHFDLCGETLSMPTTIVGQNGATIQQNTKIAIEGCGAVKSAKARKLTRAQKLARALKACRKEHRHSKVRRIRCERQARRRFPLHKHTTKRHAKTRTRSATNKPVKR